MGRLALAVKVDCAIPPGRSHAALVQVLGNPLVKFEKKPDCNYDLRCEKNISGGAQVVQLRGDFMESTTLNHQASTNEPVFAGGLRENKHLFGYKPFLVQHNLSRSGLFRLPRLREVGRELLKRERSGRALEAAVSLPSWKESTAGARLSKEDQFEKALDELDSGTLASSCKLTALSEVDPAYDAVLRDAIGQLAAELGVPFDDITWSMITVFITAPNVLTRFHSDWEQNFLLQVQGEKDVHLYDRNDLIVFPQVAFEELCKGNPAPAPYREEFKDRGTVFRIEPGIGVHHPVNAPHSVANGNFVSISVTVVFCTKELDDISRVHQANLFLRSVGFRPPFPDLSTRRDRIKASLFRGISGPRDCEKALCRGYRRLTYPARMLRDILRRA